MVFDKCTDYFYSINPKTLDNLDPNVLLEVFRDPAIARQLLERFRWPKGPCCPHCDSLKSHYAIRPQKDSRNPARPGLLGCKNCKKQFTVTVGTPLDGTKVPLALWMVALFWVFSRNRKGSVYALNKRTRELGVTYKTTKSIVSKVRNARSDIRSSSSGKSLSSNPTFGEVVRLVLSITKKKRTHVVRKKEQAQALSEGQDWAANITHSDGLLWSKPQSLKVRAQSLPTAYHRAARDYYKRYLGQSDNGLKEITISLTPI